MQLLTYHRVRKASTAVLVILVVLSVSLIPQPVQAAVTFGTPAQTHTGGNPVSHVSTATLDDSTFVFAYKDERNANYGTIAVGTIASGVVSFGTNQVFNSSTTSYINVNKIDATRFLLTYTNSSNHGRAVVGTVSGTTISFGDVVTFDTNSVVFVSASMLDSNSFVISYRALQSTYRARSVIATISGSTVSLGTVYEFINGTQTQNVLSVGLSATKFIVFTEEGSAGSTVGNMILGTIADGVITYGTSVTYRSSVVYTGGAIKLDSTHAAIGWRDPFDSNNATFTMVATESNGTLTAGTRYKASNDIASTQRSISLVPMTSTTFALNYGGQGGGVAKSYIATVSNGNEITYGSASTLDNGGLEQDLWSTYLDATRYVTGYRNSSDNNRAAVKISTVSGTTITHGTKYTISSNAGDVTSISTDALSSTQTIVAFADGASIGKAAIGTVSGDSVTFGATATFNNATTDSVSVTALSASTFAVVYKDTGASSHGRAAIGIITDGVITFGAEYAFNAATTDSVSISALNSSTFVVAYKDTGASSHGRAVVGTVSGNVITFGAEYAFNAATTDSVSVTALSASTFAVAYKDTGASSHGRAAIGTVANTNEITFGAEYVFNAATTDYVSATTLNASTFAVAYKDTGGSNYGRAAIGTVANTNEITFGAEYVFNAATTNYVSAATIDSTNFMVSYADTGNSDYGTAVFGAVSGTVVTFGSENVYSSATTTINSTALIAGSNFIVAYRNTAVAIAYGIIGSNDVTPPTIIGVSSDKANGAYTVGEIIDIDITFSEAVTSTGNVTVTLETGDTDRTCTFTVSNATTGTCNYTVQAGDASEDLTVKTISGTIEDQAGNAMINFVPVTNLAANKAIVVDTTAPILVESTPVPASGILTTPSYTFTSDEAGTITYAGSCSSATTEAVAGSNTIVFSALVPGTYSNCTIAVADAIGNTSASLAVSVFTISSPPVNSPSSNSSSGDAEPLPDPEHTITGVTVDPNVPLTVRVKAPDADQVKSVIIKINGKIHTLKMDTSDPNNPLFTARLSLELPSGTYTYTLTVDYGSTNRHRKGTIVVTDTSYLPATPMPLVGLIVGPRTILFAPHVPTPVDTIEENFTLEAPVSEELPFDPSLHTAPSIETVQASPERNSRKFNVVLSLLFRAK